MAKITIKGFRLVGWKGGQRCAFGKWGVIDLNTLTEKQAAQLVANGFPYLKMAKKTKPKEKEEAA